MKTTNSFYASFSAGKLVASATVALGLLQAGCLSFSIGDSATPHVDKYMFKTIDKGTASKCEIDRIIPEVSSVGYYDGIRISFKLIGSIAMVEKTESTIRHSAGRRMSFGLFPGAAADQDTGEAVGTVFASIWYNILFVGTPTISGVLVEPFVSADTAKRSALFGFHKWKIPSWTERKSDSKEVLGETFLLEDFTCVVSGDGVNETRKTAEKSEVYINNPHGCKSIEVKLEIPHRHPLKKQLEPFEKTTFKISIPGK